MKLWDPTFCPSYTPLEMFELGIFEGKYLNEIKEVPAAWKAKLHASGKHVKPGQPADPSINRFGVKARMPLSNWKKKGWLFPEDPEGWVAWYIKYFLGRRVPEMDAVQIKRFRSFVARHQAQVSQNCSIKDFGCRPRQRQGLLQWGWDSTTPFTESQQKKNAERIARAAGASIGVPALEQMPSAKW